MPVSELLAASTDLHWRLVAANERGDAQEKLRLHAQFQVVRDEIQLRRGEIDAYLRRSSG
jgi:hypothetical protein